MQPVPLQIRNVPFIQTTLLFKIYVMINRMTMTITLTPEQQQWLEAEVAAGHFSSVEDAVRVAVAQFQASIPDDLSWARPYVDEARRSVARGEVISGEEFLGHLHDSLKDLRSS
jgi:antitoxin ParD1/3/4